jgi:transglutaminase-like putative cysteine protease
MSLPKQDVVDAQFAAQIAVDHQRVNWDDVRSTGYLIHQQFHYEYDGPIRDLRQRLVIIPPERYGDQRLITHRLECSSPTTEMRREIDRFGNLVIWLLVDQVAREIDFTAWIVVEREREHRPTAVTGEVYHNVAFREFTPLTTPNADLRAAALEIRRDQTTELGVVRAINAWVYEYMTYTPDATGVRTSAAEAFALKQGVCQDYAHIMLTLCRLCAIPARYISGHLLGEGGTHAWVDVLVPDETYANRYVALPFDPTNGNEPGLNYVTIAIGRDYGDVAPTSGSYTSPHAGQLSTRKRAAVTSVSYDSP